MASNTLPSIIVVFLGIVAIAPFSHKELHIQVKIINASCAQLYSRVVSNVPYTPSIIIVLAVDNPFLAKFIVFVNHRVLPTSITYVD
jgi:hypothetical protein